MVAMEVVTELTTDVAIEVLLELMETTLLVVLLVLVLLLTIELELAIELDPDDGSHADPRTAALIETPLVLPPEENSRVSTPLSRGNI